ncbi:MAG: Ig-like domain-containing protein [Gemmatimonadaceae bacterium]|nr:Ig-like domain-containing protein [Gemmatimonadaceae bacterium]
MRPALLLASLALTACLDTPVDTTGVVTNGQRPSPNAILGLTMRYVSVDLEVGESKQLAFTPTLSGTGAFIPASVAWQSTVPAVATVDANGIVTAVQPGSTFVTVTVDGHSGQTTVTVHAPPAAGR